MSAADIALVGSVYSTWGSGAYLGDSGDALIAQHIHPDCIWDTSADMKNTDMYKLDGGVGKGCAAVKEWVTRLLEFEFPGFTLELFSAGEGAVIVRSSTGVKCKATGKEAAGFVDLAEWRISDGKIISVKIFFGNPAGVDALMA
ncbi:hypothetical protein B484DRAFT_415633 [Ochromonadaceae sp. CCMP2298]|nr:hypothetical protein B484DRAFT_415633 [Ochromonadaceae sp. CCMP2298]